MCRKHKPCDKAMKKSQIIHRYDAIKSPRSLIAKACGVSPTYVYMVLRGERVPKSKRASKAHEILKKAEAILAIFQEQKPAE